MANKFKLTEYTHPADIFKHQENLRADRIWALKEEKIELPKYVKTQAPKLNAGVWNFIKDILRELAP